MTTTAAGSAALAVAANCAIAEGTRGADAIPGLDEYCRRAIADWKVPGMALAVVRDGRLLLARGFGVRELGHTAPVDENTIFSVASCGKSFTAAVIGMLVDQGQLAWDDPINKHVDLLGNLNGDAGEPTIRHALQHRTGFPSANMLWRSGEFDGDEILRRVRLFKPVAAPGEKFLYNNVMYLAAGRAAQRVSRKTWTDLVTAELFQPLGMNSTVAESSQLARFDNLASPHATIDGEVRPVARYCPDVIAPAGTIHSTAADMAQWLMLHLDRGRFGGRELLTAGRVDEMHTPVDPPPLEVPRAPISRYGLGWFVNEFAGRTVVEHSGTQNGFVSWMALMPKERLGLVILSNHHQTGLNLALRSWIFDRLLGRPEQDWSGSVLRDYTQGWQKLLREAKAEFDARHPAARPASLPLAVYAGDYESRLYGTIRLIERAGQLEIRFGTRFQGQLQASQGDVFRAFFTNPRLDDWLLTFTAGKGKVRSLHAQESPWAPPWYDDRDDLGVFERR